jgi:hypothetical protein
MKGRSHGGTASYIQAAQISRISHFNCSDTRRPRATLSKQENDLLQNARKNQLLERDDRHLRARIHKVRAKCGSVPDLQKFGRQDQPYSTTRPHRQYRCDHERNPCIRQLRRP